MRGMASLGILDETIDETCRNAGEIELIFRPEKRNNVRLLLFMDVGGTMDPYYEPVSRLLTALHEERGLRDFRPYYFHNCIYEMVGTTADMYRRDAVPTGNILRQLDERWKVIIVGDAAMHPYELMQTRGNINPRYEANIPRSNNGNFHQTFPVLVWCRLIFYQLL